MKAAWKGKWRQLGRERKKRDRKSDSEIEREGDKEAEESNKRTIASKMDYEYLGNNKTIVSKMHLRSSGKIYSLARFTIMSSTCHNHRTYYICHVPQTRR